MKKTGEIFEGALPVAIGGLIVLGIYKGVPATINFVGSFFKKTDKKEDKHEKKAGNQ